MRFSLKSSSFMMAAAILSLTGMMAKADPLSFDLEAHRGGRDARPENSLYAFAYAIELGVQTLEMDMQMTKDGHIVISHNPFMSPDIARNHGVYVANGEYDLRTMSLKEIKSFDVGRIRLGSEYFKAHGATQLPRDGATMPTLEEVFELVNDYKAEHIRFNIETKSYADPLDPGFKNNPDPAAFVRAFYSIVQMYHFEKRVMLQSFDWRTLVAMHALDPNITLVALSCEQPSWGQVEGCYLKLGQRVPSPWLAGLNINDFNGDYVRAAYSIHADVVSPYWEELSIQLLREGHQLGMRVIPWTVNDANVMSYLIDMGVDGIITDRPWILREVLTRKKITTPNPVIDPQSPFHSGTLLFNPSGA